MIIAPAAVTSAGSRIGSVRGAAVTDRLPGLCDSSVGTLRTTRRSPRAGSSAVVLAAAAAPVVGAAGLVVVPTPPSTPVASTARADRRHHRGARTVASPAPFACTLAGTPIARRTASDRPVADPNRSERAATWPIAPCRSCRPGDPGGP
ncbi:hypothetical protein [Cellulomonas sp. SG140]|uniref:hypothetical protein n=1 Tax=Cellulomonas sp. SG140 TaxID=2976536 RepID=UPI0021E936C8|nr:hypothetical protein [Cellulomonas sp. SG140]